MIWNKFNFKLLLETGGLFGGLRGALQGAAEGMGRGFAKTAVIKWTNWAKVNEILVNYIFDDFFLSSFASI